MNGAAADGLGFVARPGGLEFDVGVGRFPAAPRRRSLPTLPVVQIGGTNAAVKFAGLISPGFYQFNVQVPSAPNGDNAITVRYNGLTSQSGTPITVQR